MITNWKQLWTCLCANLLVVSISLHAEAEDYSVRQITFGPQHHFFGYIGHVGTIPWNASGRYIVALRVGFQDHLPRENEAADIVLLDTQREYAARVVDRTLAWNPQQGTMLYWNPQAAKTQLWMTSFI